MRRACRCGPRRAAAAGMLAMGVALTASGCFSSGGNPEGNLDEQSALCPESAAPTHRLDRGPAGIALLADSQLARISLRSGRVEAERRLPVGNAPDSGIAAALLRLPGQLLVQPQNAGPVLVLVRRGPRGRDEILAVDPATLGTRCRYPLERGVRYRGITVGASARIYAYGYRDGRDVKKVAAVLTTLDPESRPRPVTRTVRPANSEWLPYWGTVAPDERHVVLSYHGSDTTGADWLDAAGSRFRRCPSVGGGAGCVTGIHGAVAPYGAGFLATTGSGMVEVDWNGHIVNRLPVRPWNVHLMDFVLDEPHGLVYVSSCGQHPAIQRLDLAEMRVMDLPSGRVCGLPLAVYEDRFLVLAASPVDEGFVEAPVGRLRVLDLRHPGQGVQVRLTGTPQDAIVLDAAG
jgi:hypothetical protein